MDLIFTAGRQTLPSGAGCGNAGDVSRRCCSWVHKQALAVMALKRCTAAIDGIAHHGHVSEMLTMMRSCRICLSATGIRPEMMVTEGEGAKRPHFCRLTRTLLLTTYGLNMKPACYLLCICSVQ